MRDGALVEPVDLQLDAVKAELDEQQPLEPARRLEPDAAPAELGRDREAPRLRDSVALVHAVERDAARKGAVRVDDEPAERVGLTLGVLDLRKNSLARVTRPPAEEGPRVLVRDEAEQEVCVLGART